MRVLAKRSMNLLRGPQGLWRSEVASNNAPRAVSEAGILGKGDGQIAPIGAFWLYALSIAQPAATEPTSTNDGERRTPWVPPLLFPSPQMSEKRTAWPTEGRSRRAFGWRRSGSAVQRMRMEKPAGEGRWEGESLWKSRSQFTSCFLFALLREKHVGLHFLHNVFPNLLRKCLWPVLALSLLFSLLHAGVWYAWDFRFHYCL